MSPFGTLLRRYRRAARMTQETLADKAGLSVHSISNIERGAGHLPRKDTVQLLAQALQLSEQETAAFIYAASRPTYSATSLHPNVVWNLPLRRNPFFVGRADLLRQMHAHAESVPLPLALCGMGGIGKTQLAVEYAYRYAHHYTAVFWFEAETSEALLAGVAALADVLGLPEQQDQRRTAAAIVRWLSEHPGWLVVLDNVEDLRLVSTILPADTSGAVILTTRRQVTEPIAQAMDVPALSASDGARLLLQRTKRLSHRASLDDAATADVSIACAITRHLGGLPLALDQAGAYMLETGCNLTAYQDLLQHRQTTLLQRRGAVPTDHPLSVTATLGLALDQIERANEAVFALLQCCAFLHPDAIPLDFFVQAGAELGPTLHAAAQDPEALDLIIALVRQYSLVQRDSQANTLSLHRLVQVLLRDRMALEVQRCWAERMVHALAHCFPNETTVEHFPDCRRYLAHALRGAALMAEWQITGREAAQLCYHVGGYLHKQGDYTQAEALLQQALSLQRECSGEEHTDVTAIMNDLGLLFIDTGQYSQAETLLYQTLHLRERLFADPCEALAESVNNLGYLYDRQGRYAEAEPYHRQAVAMLEQVLGPEHPQTVFCLSSLGYVYSHLHQYAQAEAILTRAIALQEQAVGPEHPDLLHGLNNLGCLYLEQDRYAEAESLLQRAVAISEQVYGVQHPVRAYMLTNLGKLSRLQGQRQRAIDYHQRALAIRRECLESPHALIATSLVYLGQLLLEDGHDQHAEAVLREAAAMYEHLGGQESPDAQLGYACLHRILAR